ncbi:hypothetical protein [Endozoicomonas sp. GU-1]|uniref:hypothetical protein n=1 Tax=Endozoicomonas sp. GU-1 TaxID=3009078 RepID=UPI0022B5C307|nr:hypothetical protein [Endozoicomonas sp. GU-1]WBA81437.1 hypothetical protein O2T12_24695 [Endozoicomonas sp. GU-1]WBA84384.1 hypothetical protein O3276_13855 [Endozoicomonas sp. GU-1]
MTVDHYQDWNRLERDGNPEETGTYRVVFRNHFGELQEVEARFFKGWIFEDIADETPDGFYRKKENTRPNPYDYCRSSDYDQLDVKYWKAA